MEATDLDVVVPEPKTVRFGGVEYRVPSDLPMEIFLRINLAGTYKNEEGGEDLPRQLDSLLESLTDLLLWEQIQPDGITLGTPEQRSAIKQELRRRSVKQCFGLVNAIYKDDDEADDQKAAATAEANGTPLAQAPGA